MQALEAYCRRNRLLLQIHQLPSYFNSETNGARAGFDTLSVFGSVACFFPPDSVVNLQSSLQCLQGVESTVLPHAQLPYLLLHISVFHHFR